MKKSPIPAKERHALAQKKWYESHKDYAIQQSKNWYYVNRDRILAEKRIKDKIRYDANKDKMRSEARERYKRNKEFILQRCKNYRNNPEIKTRIKEYHKIYYSNPTNYARKIKNNLRNVKRRRQEDKSFAVECCLRSRLHHTIKKKVGIKSVKTLELLGCSIEFLLQHLESKFYNHPKTGEPMSWDNYSFRGWHIDHIKPCTSFNLADPEQQKQCFNWSNLQPLWSLDNWQKGAKLSFPI